jgi:hypothetical protein
MKDYNKLELKTLIQARIECMVTNGRGYLLDSKIRDEINVQEYQSYLEKSRALRYSGELELRTVDLIQRARRIIKLFEEGPQVPEHDFIER